MGHRRGPGSPRTLRAGLAARFGRLSRARVTLRRLAPVLISVGAVLLVAAAATAANPSNRQLPTVTGSSGTPFVSGEQLTANTSPADWTYSGSLAFAYQWEDCASYP